jgi:endonuclease
MPLYDKPVRLLMHDMVNALNLQPGEVFDREQVLDWFRENYALVKHGTVTAHLTRMSTNAPSRIHHRLQSDGSDELFYQIDSSRYRLYDPNNDPAPIREQSDQAVTREPTPVESNEASAFAYEHDLRDYLAKNLNLVEPGLRLYSEEGITGLEFPAGGRSIDILAVDRDGSYVVIELKVSKGYDRAVGQLLRYMGWIEQHQAEPGQRVRGVIVAKEISTDLKLACARVRDVQLFEYDLSVSLRQIAG